MEFGRELHRSCDLVNVSSMNSGLQGLNVEEVIPLNIVYITALLRKLRSQANPDCPFRYRSFRASSTTCFSTIQVDEIRRIHIKLLHFSCKVSSSRALYECKHYFIKPNSREYEIKSIFMGEYVTI